MRVDKNAFTFSCPHCGQHLEVELDMAGMTLDCPHCGNAISVPQAPSDESAAGEEPRAESVSDHADPSVNASDAAEPTVAAHPPHDLNATAREDFLLKNQKWIILAAIGATVLVLSVVSSMSKATDGKREPLHRPAIQNTDEDDAASSNYVPTGGNRQFVRDHIKQNDNCRLVALTMTGGNVVVCGNNDWAADGCPREMLSALQKITDENDRIIDVCLTELGRYIILYGGNAAIWKGIPYEMKSALQTYNSNGEELYSATFNDAGDWIVVSSEHYTCSATWLQSWLADGSRQYGVLRAAAVSSDAAVAVYDGGFAFYGNVPEELKEALRNAEFKIRTIKVAGSAWFFADEYGYLHCYYM